MITVFLKCPCSSVKVSLEAAARKTSKHVTFSNFKLNSWKYFNEMFGGLTATQPIFLCDAYTIINRAMKKINGPTLQILSCFEAVSDLHNIKKFTT